MSTQLDLDEILTAHNSYREEVDVPPLTWSDDLASHAQEWADRLASIGGHKLPHSKNTGEGENLWVGTSESFTNTQMVNRWGKKSSIL